MRIREADKEDFEQRWTVFHEIASQEETQPEFLTGLGREVVERPA